jgi:hypothetical protein
LLHVHTRWLGYLGPPVAHLWEAPFGFFLPRFHINTEWGSMWSTTLGDVPDLTTEEWTPGRSQAEHLAVLYELSRPVLRPGIDRIIGVASPFPIDTASILGQIRDSLRSINQRVTTFRTNLTPDSLRQLEIARIQSVRIDLPEGYQLNQYSEPISTGQLAEQHNGTSRISAVTVLLDHTYPPTVVNLFEDNQFYVADPTPESIGEVATRISPLWGPSNVDML